MKIIISAAVLLLGSMLPASAETITGLATVIDGDTISVAGQRIRLWGIDAPERGQTCEGGSGVYECGRDASDVLGILVRVKTVSCEPRDRDRRGRIVAACSTEAGDLGEAMVRSGRAIDTNGKYVAEQAKAKAERAGVWGGKFIMPAEYRKGVR